MKNTMTDVQAYKELMLGGGQATVPCMKIELPDGQVQWMYESMDIIDFLSDNLAEIAQPSA